MGGRGNILKRVLDEGRSENVFTEQVVVLIKEPGQIEVQRLSHQPPESQFVAVQFLGLEIAVGAEARKERYGRSALRVRSRAKKSGKEKVALDVGRRANRVSHRSPERLGIRGSPEQPAAR